MGVSRPTFDAAIRGLEPDLSLPDLALPDGRSGRRRSSPNSCRRPPTTCAKARSPGSPARARSSSPRIAPRSTPSSGSSACRPQIILAIWGRETAFGGYKLPHDALRVLATQAYAGRRKDMFRGEFLAALKMLQDGVPRERMRSSWGGAMGLTQFLPSEYYKHAVDFDGDGKVDIWTSIPDALASAAKQLANKGWVRGERWAYEVRVPRNVDCTIAQPGARDAGRRMAKRGYVAGLRPQARGRRAEERGVAAAAGGHLRSGVSHAEELLRHQGIQFLRPLRSVRRPSQRPHRRWRPFEKPWSKNAQLRTEQVEAMQKTLTERGLYRDKVDGKAGMLTRAALGEYQKANGLKLDCWPTAAVLAHMQGRR